MSALRGRVFSVFVILLSPTLGRKGFIGLVGLSVLRRHRIQLCFSQSFQDSFGNGDPTATGHLGDFDENIGHDNAIRKSRDNEHWLG